MDVGLLALVVGVVVIILLGSASLRPYDAPELDPRPILLPVYLLRSLIDLLRQVAAAPGVDARLRATAAQAARAVDREPVDPVV